MTGLELRRLLGAARHRRARLKRQAQRALAKPHRTIVVPVLGSAESEHALDLACRLAAERRSRVMLVAPLFVEAELPLDAHLHGEEATLSQELRRTCALADTYGISVRSRIIRTRHGQLGRAVARVADDQSATLIVLGAHVDSRNGFRRPFSRDIWSVLKEAPCRVMIATAPVGAASLETVRLDHLAA